MSGENTFLTCTRRGEVYVRMDDVTRLLRNEAAEYREAADIAERADVTVSLVAVSVAINQLADAVDEVKEHV